MASDSYSPATPWAACASADLARDTRTQRAAAAFIRNRIARALHLADRPRQTRAVLCAVVVVLTLGTVASGLPSANAVGTSATISGTVTDTALQPVVGATVTVFGAPHEVTLAEIAVETLLPANEATAAQLQRMKAALAG